MPCIGLQVFQGSPDINEPANFFINQLPSLGGRINLFLVLLITKECLRCSPVAVVIVYPRQKRAYPVSAVNHQYIAGCGRVPEDYAGNQITRILSQHGRGRKKLSRRKIIGLRFRWARVGRGKVGFNGAARMG